MNRLSYILPMIIAVACALCACDSQHGSDMPQDSFRYDFVTYNGYADGIAQFTYQPRLDGSPITLIAHMSKSPTVAKGRRVLLNYYITSQNNSSTPQSQEVKVNGITGIITDTLRLATKLRIDTMASEDIRLLSIWRSGHYINMNAEVLHTGKARWFYLLADRATFSSDTVECYLIHNTFGATTYHWRKAYASFYVGAAWKNPSCKAIRIHLNDVIAPGIHEYCFGKQ